jgi:hypothetical protein
VLLTHAGCGPLGLLPGLRCATTPGKCRSTSCDRTDNTSGRCVCGRTCVRWCVCARCVRPYVCAAVRVRVRVRCAF